ncbi:MAG: c-type cytochrome biogenesis protein CcmI [Caulobacter sp.]|nr:c-type cytochrome biogenesis protein CcmI [Caulobacter sp.]
MFAFWIAAAALSAGAAGLMLRGSRAAAARVAGEDPALAVHRRQLAEIDDLAARDLLPADAVRAARAEAARRLLTVAGATATPGSVSDRRRTALAVAAVTPLLAVVLYLASGAPGAPDQPYAQRLADWRKADPATLDPPHIAAVMRAIVVERPTDAEAFKHLALAEMTSGDAMAASAALRRAVALAPERADLWAALGEVFVAEGDGEIGVDARKAFAEALKQDPTSLSARYFLARADIADGKLAEGLAGWRALLASLPAGDSSRAGLAAEIAAVEKAGGLVQAQPAPAQPDAAAIRGMVERLAARLDGAPDDPEGWVRLVKAWSVLGETGKRDAARARARGLYADRPDILRALDEAAQ